MVGPRQGGDEGGEFSLYFPTRRTCKQATCERACITATSGGESFVPSASRSYVEAAQAFALLATPSSGLPPFDPMPGLKHVSTIADDACYLIGDTSVGVSLVRHLRILESPC